VGRQVDRPCRMVLGILGTYEAWYGLPLLAWPRKLHGDQAWKVLMAITLRRLL
jgi:hypothetical protein